jgi:hypothetical protein
MKYTIAVIMGILTGSSIWGALIGWLFKSWVVFGLVTGFLFLFLFVMYAIVKVGARGEIE